MNEPRGSTATVSHASRGRHCSPADGKGSLRRQLSEKARALNRLLMEHKDMVRRYCCLQKELDRAARVQQSLLPVSCPSLDGYQFAHLYRPCKGVGGDFYDFVQGKEGLVVIVSDIICHGFEAGLATMLMKEIFEETAAVTSDPVELLTKMNGRLNRILPEGMFVAAAVVKLSSHLSQPRFANAGLPYPFVLRGRERWLNEVNVAGLPLGLLGDGKYEACKVTLNPGDVFLISTDGTASIQGDDGEFFGDYRLGQVLAELAGFDGQKVIETLMEEAVNFGKNRPLPDDIYVLAITRDACC